MDKKGKNKTPRNTQFIIIAIVAGLVMLLAISMFNTWIDNATTKEISYNQFIEKLEAGEIGVVYKQADRLVVKPKNQISTLFELVYYTGIMEDETSLQQRLEAANKAHGVQYGAEIPDSSSILLDFLLVWVLPLVLFYLVLGFFMKRSSKGGGIMGVGKSNAKIYGQKETGVTFKDVAGQDEAKESMTEIVDFLHNPGKYAKIGAKLPKGALLVGPPGTGKTLLAKAVAGEAKVPFFSLSGSDFVEMFVGVGASRVRDLFKNAQASAPCIIFIDEIDAIGKSRDSRYGGGNDEREQTLNQLLAEMDGFDTSKGIFILAATNRPDVLDKALLRPGRFDRRIIVDKPDLKGRVDILKVHSKDKRLDSSVNLKTVALSTSGFTGADLSNLMNEAAIMAARDNRPVLNMKDLNDAMMKIIAGPEKRSRVRQERDLRITAVHEAGHAVAMHSLPTHDPVHQISVIPRGQALGLTWTRPSEDSSHMTRNEMYENIVGLLGGRVAEALFLQDISTGASNDIDRASKLARDMVARYGMCENLGTVSYTGGDEIFVGRDYEKTKSYSEKVAGTIDDEVKALIDRAYRHCEEILKRDSEKLDRVVEYLLANETMTGDQFADCMEGKEIREAGETSLFDAFEPKED